MMHGGGWWAFLSQDEQVRPTRLDKRLLRRVWGYARPYWGYITIVLAIIIFTSLLNLIPPLLFRDLIDNVLPNRDFHRLNLVALALLGIPLVTGLIGVAERYLSSKAGEGIIFDLRQAMYDHLVRLSIRFYTHTKSGEIISRFNNDVIGAQNAFTGSIPDVVTNVVTLVSTLVVMITIEWHLALLSVAVLPLFLLPARRVALILREVRRRALEYNADMSNAIGETLGINGALLVKIFGTQRREINRFLEINQKTRDIGIRRALVGRWFFLGLGMSGAIGTALIYWIGGHLVLSGAISVGTIVAFAAYLMRLYGPISALTNVNVEFVSSIVSFERVFEYLDLPVEIEDQPGAIDLQATQGRVRFERVCFSYYTEEELALKETLADQASNADGKEPVSQSGGNGAGLEEAVGYEFDRRWAIQDTSFEIESGELVALVGRSGAGKTTITYLLPRLYEPTEGRITLDGHDLRAITLESLARQIGMVTQETYLFHDTIRNNLLYAKPGASDAEIEAACQAANIHDFITSLPEGYDTLVGERGYRLSGGEKQRLAIARVILKDPRILILDEATSHLDSQNEALIQAALAPLFRGRSSLVIAHRLSTILAADKILVLEKGKLVEQGTHAELLRMGGLYARLYETQFGKDEAKLAGDDRFGQRMDSDALG